MKQCYVTHAWNLAHFENGRVLNDERYFKARTYLLSMLQYIYALMFYDYVEYQAVR